MLVHHILRNRCQAPILTRLEVSVPIPNCSFSVSLERLEVQAARASAKVEDIWQKLKASNPSASRAEPLNVVSVCNAATNVAIPAADRVLSTTAHVHTSWNGEALDICIASPRESDQSRKIYTLLWDFHAGSCSQEWMQQLGIKSYTPAPPSFPTARTSQADTASPSAPVIADSKVGSYHFLPALVERCISQI